MLVVKEFGKKFYVVNTKSGKRQGYKNGYDSMKEALKALAELKKLV